MIKPVVCSLTSLLLAGCVSFGTSQLADPGVMEQIKVGETTKDQVARLLGEPETRIGTTLTGVNYEGWTYRYAASVINPLEYLLLYGFLYNGPGAHDQIYMLAVSFGPDDVVLTRDYTKTSYDLGTPITNATVTSDARVDSRPGRTGIPVRWDDQVVGQRYLRP